MLQQLVRNWWVLALRGMAALVFAVVAFASPGLTLAVLVWVWGAYAVADGVLAVIAAVRAAESGARWGMLLMSGICGIAAGLIAFIWPEITASAMAYLFAAWAIVTGAFEIGAAVHLRQLLEGEWRLGLTGALSILLGVLVMIRPGAGLLAWVWMIGTYALLAGIFTLWLGMRLRALGRSAGRPAPV